MFIIFNIIIQVQDEIFTNNCDHRFVLGILTSAFMSLFECIIKTFYGKTIQIYCVLELYYEKYPIVI